MEIRFPVLGPHHHSSIRNLEQAASPAGILSDCIRRTLSPRALRPRPRASVGRAVSPTDSGAMGSGVDVGRPSTCHDESPQIPVHHQRHRDPRDRMGMLGRSAITTCRKESRVRACRDDRSPAAGVLEIVRQARRPCSASAKDRSPTRSRARCRRRHLVL
jgi:hypothetical protein